MNEKNILNNIKKFMLKRSSSALLKNKLKNNKFIPQPNHNTIRKSKPFISKNRNLLFHLQNKRKYLFLSFMWRDILQAL